jgi:hypothetical protein
MQPHEIVGQVRKGSRPPASIGASPAAKPAPRAKSRSQAGGDASVAAARRKGPRYGCGF